MTANNNVLVVVDFSAWLYMTIFNAMNNWSKKNKAEFASLVKPPEETDQDNIPNLLVSETFKRELKNSVMKKLHSIDWILKRNCQDILDVADEIVVVFAEDDFVSNNFRRKLYPEYKAQRSLGNKSWDYGKARDYVVNSILPELDLYKKNGYIRIGVPGAEADDVIAVMMQNDGNNWAAKILISSDHDFCQIENIKQFNIFGDEVIPWVDKDKGIKMTPKESLLVKCLCGDSADGIPQIMPRLGVKTAWKLLHDKEKLKNLLKENENAAKQFLINKKLISFEEIPVDLKDKILNIFNKKINDIFNQTNKTNAFEIFDLNAL